MPFPEVLYMKTFSPGRRCSEGADEGAIYIYPSSASLRSAPSPQGEGFYYTVFAHSVISRPGTIQISSYSSTLSGVSSLVPPT